MRDLLRRFRWLFLAIAVVLICVISWRLFHKTTHVRPGQIQTAKATDAPQKLNDVMRGGVSVKDAKWREILAGEDSELTIGPAKLEWSLGGYLYFYDSHQPSLPPVWEFAPCARKELSEVTSEDLRCDYYGAGNLNGTNVFGKRWGKRAITVKAGEIVLARLVKSPGMIYPIKVQEQTGDKVRVEFKEMQSPK